MGLDLGLGFAFAPHIGGVHGSTCWIYGVPDNGELSRGCP
jgi:hypothetical protein